MINSGNISARVKAITDELMAMKSLQNMGVHGLKTPSASASWSGFQSGGYSAISPIKKWVVTFTPNVALNSPPFATLAYSYTDDSVRKFWYKAWIANISASKIEWSISSRFNNFSERNGRNVTINAQVISLVAGTLQITEVL